MPDVFYIAPAQGKALWVLAAIAAVLLGILLLLAYFGYSSRATRYEISPAGLAIRGTLYGRTVPWASLDLDGARTVDLREPGDLRPTLRTNGLGLPGYQTGWFRLRSGSRGLLFVTDASRVLAVPTHERYVLLMSARDPDGLLRALRAAAPTR